MKNKKNILSIAIAIGLLTTSQAMAGDIENTLSATGDNMTIKQGTNELMRVQGDGKVGIGVLAPTKELEVAGTIKTISGSYSGFSLENTDISSHWSIANADYSIGNGLLVEREGTYLFSIHESGKVGIGTHTPSYKLTVRNRDGFASGEHKFSGFQGESGGVSLLTGYMADGTTDTSVFIRGGGKASDLHLGTYNTEQAVTITNDGNVGIGTTTPTEKLHIYSDVDGQSEIKISNPNPGASAYSQLALTNDINAEGGLLVSGSNAFTSSNQQNALILQASGVLDRLFLKSNKSGSEIAFAVANNDPTTADMVIKDGGNVGIGTINPTAKLDVAGSIKIASTGVACTAATAGQIHYETTSNKHQGCNGTAWTNLY